MFFVFITRGLILTAIWQFATFVFSLSHQSLLLFHYSFHLKTNPPNHVLRLLIRIPSFQCSPTQKSLLASLVVSNNTPASSSFIVLLLLPLHKNSRNTIQTTWTNHHSNFSFLKCRRNFFNHVLFSTTLFHTPSTILIDLPKVILLVFSNHPKNHLTIIIEKIIFKKVHFGRRNYFWKCVIYFHLLLFNFTTMYRVDQK